MIHLLEDSNIYHLFLLISSGWTAALISFKSSLDLSAVGQLLSICSYFRCCKLFLGLAATSWPSSRFRFSFQPLLQLYPPSCFWILGFETVVSAGFVSSDCCSLCCRGIWSICHFSCCPTSFQPQDLYSPRHSCWRWSINCAISSAEAREWRWQHYHLQWGQSCWSDVVTHCFFTLCSFSVLYFHIQIFPIYFCLKIYTLKTYLLYHFIYQKNLQHFNDFLPS